MSRQVLLLLVSILVFGFVLRVLYLPQGAVNFMYDQARDAYAVKEIINGNFKILGPPSSSEGLSHGVFYYYLIAPAYLLGKGNPVVVSYFLALVNILGGLIIFFFTRALVKKDLAAIIATLLYASSFEITQYSVWLANPGVAVVTVPTFYFGLWCWVQQKKKLGVFLCSIGLGLSIQSQIFLLYHLIPLLVILTLKRKVLTTKDIVTFFLILLLCLSTMILSEFKFGFRTVRGLLGIAANQNGIENTKGLFEHFLFYITLFVKSLSRSLVPTNLAISSGIVLGLIVSAASSLKGKTMKPETFVLLYLLSFTFIFRETVDNIPHLFVGLAPAIIILCAVTFQKMFEGKAKFVGIALLILVVYSNISSIIKENKKGQTLLSTQKSMTIGNQKSLIDKTYASKEPFSVNNVTAPLYINITWTYLYKWYGEEKYGYLPTYAGKGQDGQVDALPQSGDIKDKHFLIIEPLWGIPRRYKDEIIGEEDSRSILVSETEYGELVLQERKKIIN